MSYEASHVSGNPEIAIPDYSTLRSLLHAHTAQAETSVNVLELRRTDESTVERRHLDDLDHESLVGYLENSNGQAEQPSLRILLLNSETLKPEDPVLGASIDQEQVALNPITIEYLVQSLGVSPVFFSTITTTPWLLDTGNALFKSYSSDDHKISNLSSLQGFFRFSDKGRPSHVWFKHNIADHSATYIIQGCPQRVTDIVNQWSEASNLRDYLFRPLALESLLIDEVAWTWSKAVVDNAKRLLEYEHFSKEENADRIDTAVHSLHTLSQHFHILQEELNGMVEQLDYLIGVHDLLSSTSFRAHSPSPGGAANTSVADSLRFLRSRTHNWQRWVGNWKERTNIRIHLFFNLATQRDNGTNANIAHFTSEIATETHKDSSSMMTIAILTLVFLPGTFIAGVFSMPMVEQSIAGPSAGWKLYLSITVPLTVVVILAWNVWRLSWHTRQARKYPTSRPAPEAPPLNPTGLDSLPNTSFGRKIRRLADSPGDKQDAKAAGPPDGPHNPRYDLKIHIPPRSPPLHTSMTDLSVALSKALNQIDSPRQTAGASSSPLSWLKSPTQSRARTPASASLVPLPTEDIAIGGRTVLDPNSPPFEGFGMWAPDPIQEHAHHSGRSTEYIPLAQITQRTSTRSRFSSRRQSRASGMLSGRSSRRSSPMARGSISRRSSILLSHPQSNVATPAKRSPMVLPSRPRSNSETILGEVRFAQSLSHERRGRSATRSVRNAWSSSSSESLDSVPKNTGRRRPSAGSRSSLGINLHTPSPAPSRHLPHGILKSPSKSRTPSPGPTTQLFGDYHPGNSGGGWYGQATSPLLPLQQLPSPFGMGLPSSSLFFGAPSTPLTPSLGFPLLGQQPPSPLQFFPSINPWPSQGGRKPVAPFDEAPSTEANPTDEELVDTLRSYISVQDLLTTTKRTTREAMAAKFPNADLTTKADFLNKAVDMILSEDTKIPPTSTAITPAPGANTKQRASLQTARRAIERSRSKGNEADDELGSSGWLSY